jgi:hypothetical protein
VHFNIPFSKERNSQLSLSLHNSLSKERMHIFLMEWEAEIEYSLLKAKASEGMEASLEVQRCL